MDTSPAPEAVNLFHDLTIIISHAICRLIGARCQSNDVSAMTSRGWRSVDQAHLLQKVILLQWLNRVPEKPSEINLPESQPVEDGFSRRTLSLQHELDLANSFAFLAATTNDPRKVVAACLEEGENQRCLTVRLAMNHGNLDSVILGLGKMAKIFERVARTGNNLKQEQYALVREVVAMNQNRILIRLRSRHASSRCNFKKNKMQQPKIIPQLYEAITNSSITQISGIEPPSLTALTADIEKLKWLFEDLESLATPKARSGPGLEILAQLVVICRRIHNRGTLHQALTASSQYFRATIVLSITKLGRYSAVSRFLLQAARKYPVFHRVRILPVYIKAPNLPITELDSTTLDIIHDLMEGSKLHKAAKSHGSSSIAIEDRIRHEATLPVPVHAEIQLLFHYERNACEVPPRIFCSSKQACFLCNLFFKEHGRFILPSTHGRLYEKWALPGGKKSIGNPDGDIVTTMWNFVSAVDEALLGEAQSTRRPYPEPCESIILQSAVCSPSNQSITSAPTSVSQRLARPEERKCPPENDIVLREGSLRPYAGKIANTSATTTMDRNESLGLRSERSSVNITNDLSPSNELPESISSKTAVHANVSPVDLKKGQLVWCKMSANPHSFEVRTPQILLIISQDELLQNLQSQDTSNAFAAGSDHYWIIFEYRLEPYVQQDETVPIVNLPDVPCESEMTVESSSAEWPREFRVYCKDDIISITYSLSKPVEGLECRVLKLSKSIG